MSNKDVFRHVRYQKIYLPGNGHVFQQMRGANRRPYMASRMMGHETSDGNLAAKVRSHAERGWSVKAVFQGNEKYRIPKMSECLEKT